MVSQHRRGGRHAVKDEDLTHTKYDEYNRDQLLAAVREAGCYVKDDKKSVMARKLADHDRDLKRKEIRALQERKEKKAKQKQDCEDAAAARTTRRRARGKRNQDRRRRREKEQEEDVSTDSDDTEDLDERDRNHEHKLTVTGGEALSDDTWDDTCSETSICSVNPRIAPACKLQLFEWPYTTMPSSHPPEDFRFERFPSLLTYTPMKLLTTHTQERITLPGMKYPPDVEPDFVPIADPSTRAAARRGHKIGILAGTVIERATSWAERTIVSGWNGRMYFALSQSSAKELDLQSVYHKRNLEQSKLLKPTPGATDVRADRKHRRALRLASKRKKTAEVYEASKWQPLALAYMPAYLDWEQNMDDSSCLEDGQTIETLYYIRFHDCDLPLYYFWTKADEWSDPTTPDPSWNLEASELQNKLGLAIDTHMAPKSKPKKFRVRKLISPPQHRNATTGHTPTLDSVEQDLITHGLSSTLAKCRKMMGSNGKEHAWRVFTRSLPSLYPSGKLPFAPPLECVQDTCLAEKIFALLSGSEVLPFSGQESWTRDDDTIWEVTSHIEDENPLSFSDDSSEETENTHHPSSSIKANGTNYLSASTQALHRRNSAIAPQPKNQRIWTWLTNISTTPTPYLNPSSPTLSTFPSPISPLDLNHAEPPPTCPFCSSPWPHLIPSQRATHMLSHSAPALASTASAPATSNVEAKGVGVKRRHSLLSTRTLQSYHSGRAGKRVKIEAVRGWGGWGAGRSPFSREMGRMKGGFGVARWVGWCGVGEEMSVGEGDDER